jgi:hypothetical protein
MEQTKDRTGTWVDINLLVGVLGGREIKVVAEIVAEMNHKGRTVIDWRHFCKVTPMAPNNLYPILKRLETRGFICRQLDVEHNIIPHWGVLWVSPLVVRDPWMVRNKPDLANRLVTNFSRRWKAFMVVREGGTPVAGEEPVEELVDD